MFFGVTFCALLVPKVVLHVVLDASKNHAKKEGLAADLKNFRKPYNNFWSGTILRHGASWSLASGRRGRLGTGHALRSKRGGGHKYVLAWIAKMCLISSILFLYRSFTDWLHSFLWDPSRSLRIVLVHRFLCCMGQSHYFPT